MGVRGVVDFCEVCVSKCAGLGIGGEHAHSDVVCACPRT